MDFSFWLNDKEFRLNLEEKTESDILVSLGKRKYHVSVEFLSPDEILLNIDGKIYDIIINSNSSYYSVSVNGKSFKIERKSAQRILKEKVEKPKKQDIRTSMPGRVVKVLKMQNEIKSPRSGIIITINPKAGDSVESGSLLFSVE
jgi:acetyl/propionyl-CoA carboxylase alpha subunit